MQRLRDQRLCFRCERPGHPFWKCSFSTKEDGTALNKKPDRKPTETHALAKADESVDMGSVELCVVGDAEEDPWATQADPWMVDQWRLWHGLDVVAEGEEAPSEEWTEIPSMAEQTEHRCRRPGRGGAYPLMRQPCRNANAAFLTGPLHFSGESTGERRG